jgi:hypothetical protein
MTSPFTLRNDFANEPSISVIQQEGECNFEFEDSGQRIPVENLISPLFINKDGHAFKIQILKAISVKSM